MSKKAEQQVSLNTDELKDFLKHIIENNRFIQKQGKVPVAVDVVGFSGVGKTSVIIQLAKEMGLPNFYKLNLAQIEELGDLVGFPIRQFRVCKNDLKDCIWIDEHAVDTYIGKGYEFTGENRMSYCPPQWISGMKDGGILMLDDWNRADPRFIQAVMELIDRQQYISWELPKDWHIVLTSNPDDGDYLVNATDDAQKTRSISVKLKFDSKCWGRWAENNQIDTRCINFLLMNPECITKQVNARSAVMFFNSILSISEFEKQLPLIQMIGEGSVGSEFASLFTTFINNRLDKIISPEEILFNPDEKYIIGKLKGVIGDIKSKEQKYRADIASVIATRVINYALFYAKDNQVKKELIYRIKNIVKNGIFSNDIGYNVVKVIFNGNQDKFKSIMLDRELVEIVMK